jgi:hypothetical protein
LRRGVGPITLATIALLAGFAVADSVAAATGYRYGETFSHWATTTVVSMPTWLRVIVRVLILVFAFSLGPHLAWGTPILP